MSRRLGGGFKNLTLPQKLIYSSAVFNVSVVGFIWLKRQMKLADREEEERTALQELTAGMEGTEAWTETNKFRCFWAAQRYHQYGAAGPEEEKDPEVQKLLAVMSKCREDLYELIPTDTPATRPLHSPPQYAPNI
eukprot:gnl/TRDRNA2_/TRDRNA2_43375_c0_seq1.p2 gnl/TRDRNA2_/TRDRNA2_43375_c0~~gnl/TRDRNA2_/TRDRNA2_43375_c0_seq1.p2  ORF type:complete len:135 (+),score=34.32 gnl/TRDRNA2_/TRDRNA2_43375_c0_seq1:80-484(+)